MKQRKVLVAIDTCHNLPKRNLNFTEIFDKRTDFLSQSAKEEFKRQKLACASGSRKASQSAKEEFKLYRVLEIHLTGTRRSQSAKEEFKLSNSPTT